MGIFSKHIGEGEKVKIDGTEFILKPLGIEYSGDFMNIGKGFSGAKQDDKGSEGMFKNFTDETMECIKRVVLKTLELSYPEEPKEERDIFAGKYLMTLLPVITKLNGQGSVDEKDSRAKQIIAAKQRMITKQNESKSTDKE